MRKVISPLRFLLLACLVLAGLGAHASAPISAANATWRAAGVNFTSASCDTASPIIDEYEKGNIEERRRKEQRTMNDKGGKEELDKPRDEIVNKKWGEKGVKPPEKPEKPSKPESQQF